MSSLATPQSQSPEIRRETIIGSLLLLGLLLVAGITASVVGFRIKSADMEKKSELQRTYLAAGGIPEQPLLKKAADGPLPSNAATTFVLAYELNQHIRGFGLATLLKGLPKSAWPQIVSALRTIDAPDAAFLIEDALAAAESQSPDAATKARRYSSKVARYVESKIFRFATREGLVKARV
jgi:hypothetical protein